jgi:hypothetical protein
MPIYKGLSNYFKKTLQNITNLCNFNVTLQYNKTKDIMNNTPTGTENALDDMYSDWFECEDCGCEYKDLTYCKNCALEEEGIN